MGAYRLQHRERADDVGAQKRLGLGQRVVDMGLGREMHDRVGLGDQLGHRLGVGDVALHQPDVVLDRCQRFAAARIRQRVQNGHRVLANRTMHEVGADETRAAGDQQPHESNHRRVPGFDLRSVRWRLRGPTDQSVGSAGGRRAVPRMSLFRAKSDRYAERRQHRHRRQQQP